MNKKDLLRHESIYDIPSIVKISKKKLKLSVIELFICMLVIALSVVLIVLYNSNLWVFLVSVAFFAIAVLVLLKTVGNIKKSSYTNSRGEIVKVFKKVTLHYPIKGSGLGVGISGKREYDDYNKEVIVITVFIKEYDSIYSYKISGVTERHVRYYETIGNAIHIYGTRFPVKEESENTAWLCPICGAFNDLNEKICGHCQNKILK